jgi:hypothetical protein
MSDATDQLARSRQALVERMSPRRPGHPGAGMVGWFADVREAAGISWRDHLVRVGFAVAALLVTRYAARKALARKPDPPARRRRRR